MKEIRPDWIKDYIDFMMAGDIFNGITLKLKNFPHSHFKYRPINNYTLESLEENTLWLADITSLNDPFECLVLLDNDECLRLYFSDKKFPTGFKSQFDVEISNDDINNIVTSKKPYEAYTTFCNQNGIHLNISVKHQIELIQKKWNEIIDREKSRIRICSFSESNDSVLMWTHYSSHHKGICVEYDFTDDDNRTFLSPVHYDDKLPILKTIEDLTPLSHLIISLIKSKNWEYEKEWRLTITKTESKIINKVKAPVLKAIYLGPRYEFNDKETKSKLLRICKQRNIPMFQMKIHPSEYKIIIDYKLT